MPKAEAGSLKALASKQKSRGLQRLKYWCQMCSKQCRDENGFKCHQATEGHLRMMTLFGEDPDRFMDTFSSDFEKGYLSLLRRRFGTREIDANQVYNEYIKDKDHVHMNSTIWSTLTDFVKYLGRTGACRIMETERGWNIAYIERDPETLRRRERALERAAAEIAGEARLATENDEKLALARSLLAAQPGGAAVSASSGRLLRASDDTTRVSLALRGTSGGGAPASSAVSVSASAALSGGFFDDDSVGSERDDDDEDDKHKEEEAAGIVPLTAATSSFPANPPMRSSWGAPLSSAATPAPAHSHASVAAAPTPPAAKRSRFDDAPAPPPVASAPQPPPPPPPPGFVPAPAPAAGPDAGGDDDDGPPWLLPGIGVKIVNERVGGGAYYKQKGAVVRVLADDPYVGLISATGVGSAAPVLLKMDQGDLETVIPAVGERVLFVRGRRRGDAGVLRALHLDDYCATVELASGELIERVDYEEISKAVGV